jgi:protoporphyrinogen oxidase
MSESKTWGIIGGGVLGMTLALRLSEYGHKVTIFESSAKAGGLAGSFKLDGVVLDRFYHVILMSDLHTRKIIKEIGLENELRWTETKTGFYSGGRLYSMSNIIEFFKFPPVNLIGKVRLGLTIVVASRIRNWKRLEGITVSEWLIRWSGKRVFEKIWLPLLKAKLGENYKSTSAAFIWTTIQRMYAARRTGLKKEMFGYVTGGYGRIISRFTERLTELGVEFRYSARVTSVKTNEDSSAQVWLQDGHTQSFDNVISTIPSGLSVQIADGLSDREKELHNNIRYLGVICLFVLLKKAVSPYYVTNITDKGYPFTGIIEMTALIGNEQMNGWHLVYLPRYANPDDSYV